MSITFAVDAVERAHEPLPERSPPGKPSSTPVIASWVPGGPLVESKARGNMLLNAVHAAFSEHRPLVLTPGAIWLTLAGGLALHIRTNAENLRNDLVKHQGKRTLKVSTGDLSDDPAYWQDTVQSFSALVHQELPELHDLVVCNFSTTDSTERMVSQVVLMDTVREYFDYAMYCVCGIPEVTLEGTAEDWEEIERRVAKLSKYGLDWWSADLLPIAKQWVLTARGKPDHAFWRAIYKLRRPYGAHAINGWVAHLFPYCIDKQSAEISERNPVIGSNFFEQAVFTSTRGGFDEDMDGMWVSSDVLPRNESRVPITAVGLNGQAVELVLKAGLMGICQNPETLALTPTSGWVVSRASADEQLTSHLLAAHPGRPPDRKELKSLAIRNEYTGLSHELQAFYSQCNGVDLTFKDGTRLDLFPASKVHSSAAAYSRINRPALDNERRDLNIEMNDSFGGLVIGQFSTGHCVIYAKDAKSRWSDKKKIICLAAPAHFTSTLAVPVIAEDLSKFLEMLISSEPPVFLSEQFVPERTQDVFGAPRTWRE